MGCRLIGWFDGQIAALVAWHAGVAVCLPLLVLSLALALSPLPSGSAAASNNEALLDAYNTAWSAALIAQGFDMDVAQTRFLPVVLNPPTNLPPGPQVG